MSRKPQSEAKPGSELLESYDNTRALGGSKKKYCVGCAGLRDVAYAEVTPCGCCGSLGTQKTIPLFDENGDLIVAQPAPDSADAIVRNYPESDAAKAVKLARQAKKAAPAEEFDTPLVVRPICAPAVVTATFKLSKAEAKQALAALFGGD